MVRTAERAGRIRRPEDITGLSDIGLIGTIPKSRDLRSRLHSEDLLRGAVGESLRHLRTNLMFADPDTAPRSVVVTSPQPAEGKSTVSALLARALALRGGKVVLIDGDLRRPMVATLFDIDPGIGLTQVLSGAVPLDEALVETDTVGLLVLPAGRIPHNPSEVVGSERMRDLIAELSSRPQRHPAGPGRGGPDTSLDPAPPGTRVGEPVADDVVRQSDPGADVDVPRRQSRRLRPRLVAARQGLRPALGRTPAAPRTRWLPRSGDAEPVAARD